VRAVLVLLAVCGALLLPVASAHAILSEQQFTAASSSNIAGTRDRPKPIALKVRIWFDSIAPDLDRQVQFAMVNAAVYFPKDGITNNRLFPSCDPAVVFTDERQCPQGSRVGTGSGRGIGLGLDERVRAQVFNAAGGSGVTMLIVGDSPLVIREIVTGRLSTLSGDPLYRYKIEFRVPRNLQSPAPGVIAAVKEFFVSIPLQYARRGGRHLIRRGRRVPYLATTGCTGGSWHAKFTADYTTSYDGAIESSQTVAVQQPCWTANEL
jgi:hypothetical protein